MKIVMLAPLYYPQRGGAETIVRSLAEGMASHGHDITVITDRRSPSSPETEFREGVRIVRTHRYLSRLTTLQQRQVVPWEECIFALQPELDNLTSLLSDTDIVHAHCTVSAFPASLIGMRLGAPVVVTPHETSPEKDPLGVEASRLLLTLSPIKRVIVGSQTFAKQVRRIGVENSHLAVTPFGVDLHMFRPDVSDLTFRKQLKLSEGEVVVTCVGRFKERKRQLDIVEAIRLCYERRPELLLRILLVGSCDAASSAYLEEIRRRIESYGLGNKIIILEDLSQDFLPPLYATSDIVLQPSTAEGLGLAVLEAQASGCAVIASAVDGLTETVHHGETGLLVELGDIEMLASSIVTLCDDTQLRKQLATNALAQVRGEYDIQRTIQQTLAEYEKVTEQGGIR
jgi:glycosyltransferase involved in cell wall biosynthesis